MANQPGIETMNPVIMATMIVCLMTVFYVAHRIMHAVVTEYGIPGGIIMCAVIYGVSLIMHRLGI
jgi:hypothetical protein